MIVFDRQFMGARGCAELGKRIEAAKLLVLNPHGQHGKLRPTISALIAALAGAGMTGEGFAELKAQIDEHEVHVPAGAVAMGAAARHVVDAPFDAVTRQFDFENGKPA